MSSLCKNDAQKVYIGNLVPSITEEDVKLHFKKSANQQTDNRQQRADSTSPGLHDSPCSILMPSPSSAVVLVRYFPVKMELKGGFGFIEFEEEVDASDAIKFMDGTTMKDRRIAVRPCGGRTRDGPREGPPGGGFRGGFGGPPGGDRDRYGGPPSSYDRAGASSYGREGGFDRPRGNDRPGQAYGFRIEAEGLADKTSWQDLKDFGRQAGQSIKYAEIFTNDTGKCGYVRMTPTAAA